jgi:hypothetical protein
MARSGARRLEGPGAAAATLVAVYARSPLPTPIEVVGFWSAILLPAVYLPKFALGVVAGRPAALLVAVHVLAVVAGHSYGR